MGIEPTYRPPLAQRIEDGYRELSQEAFAAWLMLCSVGAPVKGRGGVAKVLGLSYRRSNFLVRELRNKGYVDVKPSTAPSLPTSIFVVRQAVAGARSWIIRLGVAS
jgi:hypothetical protein